MNSFYYFLKSDFEFGFVLEHGWSEDTPVATTEAAMTRVADLDNVYFLLKGGDAGLGY